MPVNLNSAKSCCNFLFFAVPGGFVEHWKISLPRKKDSIPTLRIVLIFSMEIITIWVIFSGVLSGYFLYLNSGINLLINSVEYITSCIYSIYVFKMFSCFSDFSVTFPFHLMLFLANWVAIKNAWISFWNFFSDTCIRNCF